MSDSQGRSEVPKLGGMQAFLACLPSPDITAPCVRALSYVAEEVSVSASDLVWRPRGNRVHTLEPEGMFSDLSPACITPVFPASPEFLGACPSPLSHSKPEYDVILSASQTTVVCWLLYQHCSEAPT